MLLKFHKQAPNSFKVTLIWIWTLISRFAYRWNRPWCYWDPGIREFLTKSLTKILSDPFWTDVMLLCGIWSHRIITRLDFFFWTGSISLALNIKNTQRVRELPGKKLSSLEKKSYQLSPWGLPSSLRSERWWFSIFRQIQNICENARFGSGDVL